MPNRTSQVQLAEDPLRAYQQKFGAERTLEMLASGRSILLKDGRIKLGRLYPGESQGKQLAEDLQSLSRFPGKQKRLLECIRILQEFARAQKRKDVAAIDRLRKIKKGMNFAYQCLKGIAFSGLHMRGKNRALIGLHDDGLIVKPKTPDARAALASLSLTGNGRIDRIKQCLHCRTWFYARFKHQQFCSDPRKKCQWNHYHTPEWRRQHREKNKRHQRAYRERLFGKGKRA